MSSLGNPSIEVSQTPGAKVASIAWGAATRLHASTGWERSEVRLDSMTVMNALSIVYDKAPLGVPGVLGLESAEGLAEDYLDDPGSLGGKANDLFRYQVVKSSTSGFVTGLGGVLAFPVTIPANLASIMYVQLQMVTAIAHLGGNDIRNDCVKTAGLRVIIANKIDRTKTPANPSFWYGAGDAGDVPDSSFGKSEV